MKTLLWGVLPYVAFVLLVAGIVWRYRYDKFGWTTRSSQVYESKLLNIASPMFHYGILFVLVGHLVGLFLPESWTDKVGLTEHTYHLFSLYGGTAAGVLLVLGILLLLYRRRTNTPVFRATTANDKLMYLVLFAAIVLGMVAKLTHASGDGYNYRTSIAPWARSLFTLQPDIDRMTGVPVLYEIHAVVGMVLFALVPFTRLIHMFSAPLQYLFRPYVVYRSRDPKRVGARPDRRGWERTGS
ncbi:MULTISPECIES: respiratory nitrate reductase subunit gamma [Streptomyces]|uniref:Nitrate reductase-like protein NarX n=1 Tax=Streptomyces venezuelae TaxID=54571 RepID=A0A5P2BJ18_STRVZ|nr:MULTISPECIES: respiratory nitrate reductase subunit gamma [Streptomyces]NDZ98082.1 respiratory nitrate reductase subunit gamma [Streptomyces sp. SID10116]MYY80735.1 respiratory nitrate reductase subunit gamma [Streptomyces sp. SID335]MYZ16090.1 respiratory nitrate reductase subunit gamma [Streptomyces sp. SID337]NDZ91323.1 respiratory nitrate reductase subunit gamma [Streptomyces sp. SID10115]NEB50215.1 respiratory nitrate reductase subunit gamma [Streptomyces sp. SID339]